MIRLLQLGESTAKPKYYRCTCNYCDSQLAVPLSDIWIEDPTNSIGRISCPVCSQKVFLKGEDLKVEIVTAEEISSDEYDKARIDVSKSGLQMLREEKLDEM